MRQKERATVFSESGRAEVQSLLQSFPSEGKEEGRAHGFMESEAVRAVGKKEIERFQWTGTKEGGGELGHRRHEALGSKRTSVVPLLHVHGVANRCDSIV